MISIIIPIYNAEKYLSECFESLQKQTYSDFEVICVNDGSNDNSAQICYEYCELDSRFIYIAQENCGVSKARNKGLENVNGDWICFLDADDTLPNYALELYMRYANKYDVVAGYTSRSLSEKTLNESLCIHDGMTYLLNDYLFNNTKYQFCSFFYKKSIIEFYSIRFSEDLKFGEDEEFAWKYLSHCCSGVTLDVDLYNYRDNITSASHNVSFDRVQVIDTMIRVNSYYRSINHDFADTIYEYGIPRAKLSILKQFATNKQKDLYSKLSCSSDYDYKLTSLLSFPNAKVKIATLVYLLSSKLFYKLLSH